MSDGYDPHAPHIDPNEPYIGSEVDAISRLGLQHRARPILAPSLGYSIWTEGSAINVVEIIAT